MFRLYQSVVFLFALFLSLHAHSETSGFDNFVTASQQAAAAAAQAAADKAKLEADQAAALAATGTNYGNCQGVNSTGATYDAFVKCLGAASSPEQNIVNKIETALDQSGVPRQAQVVAVCEAMKAKATEVEQFMATATSTSSEGIVPTTDTTKTTTSTDAKTSTDKTSTDKATTGQGVNSKTSNDKGTSSGGGFDWLTSSKTIVGKGVRSVTNGRGVDLTSNSTVNSLASALGLNGDQATITGSGGTQSQSFAASQNAALASTSKDQNTITSQRLAAELNALADQCRAAQAARDSAATELAVGVQQMVEGSQGAPVDVNALLQGNGG